TRAIAQGLSDDQPLEQIMTREVIAASPGDSILEMVRKLEHHDISAMPVVEQGAVLGMISADLLARRSLLRLLQSQMDCHGDQQEAPSMRTPMCIAFLVILTLVGAPGRAALATEATVVQLRLHGAYADTLPTDNPFGPRPLHFKGLLDLIRQAMTDPNVAALSLKCESPHLGLAKVRELVQAFQEFKASGKKIYAFVEQAKLVDLLLLSVAHRLEMPDS